MMKPLPNESIHSESWWTPTVKKPEGHDFTLSDEEFNLHLLEQFGADKVAGFSDALLKTLRGFFDAAIKIGILHEARESGYRDTIDEAYEAGKEEAWDDANWRITKAMESEIAENAYEEGYKDAKLELRAEAKKEAKEEAEAEAKKAYNEGLANGVNMGIAKMMSDLADKNAKVNNEGLDVSQAALKKRSKAMREFLKYGD